MIKRLVGISLFAVGTFFLIMTVFATWLFICKGDATLVVLSLPLPFGMMLAFVALGGAAEMTKED